MKDIEMGGRYIKTEKVKSERPFNINDRKKNNMKYKYPKNLIITSKYKWYNYLPKSLFLQFTRYANCYFLLITILQCIPVVSPLSPITAIVPLVVVLLISMIREGMEDIMRHKQDYKENNEKVKRFQSNGFIDDIAMNLEVGDIIFINECSVIPADCILLTCANSSKITYIETANLDGEKNLKPKFCIPQLFKIFKNAKSAVQVRGKILSQKANSDLTKFNGRIVLSRGIDFDLSIKQFIYKGTIIKNTPWAVAVVVYTGRETKIILNSQKGASKQSHLERIVNNLILLIFCVQIILCLVLGVLNSFWFKENAVNHKYLEYSKTDLTAGESGFISFFSYILLHNTMIPISLIVTLEVVKYIQAFFMNNDVSMYSFVKSQFVRCNSSSLNEELGQIKYIFSDKTGTLTANQLEFKCAIVGDSIYGVDFDDGTPNISKSKTRASVGDRGTVLFAFDDMDMKKYSKTNHNGKIYNYYFEDGLFIECQRDLVHHYLYCLSLNHTCFIDKRLKPGLNRVMTKRPAAVKKDIESGNSVKQDDEFNKYDIYYKGENPDDIILTSTAQNMGFVYTGGDQTRAFLRLIKDNGVAENYEEQLWEYLHTIEYTSARAMMSVIVRRDGKIYLYAKGSDRSILDHSSTYQPFSSGIFERAKRLGDKGYRILMIAMKMIKEEEFTDWKSSLEEAKKKYTNEVDLKEFIKSHNRKIESGLLIIGCTGVEDKLQDKVHETIKELQTAGVNVWVLTGDNLPTAKNIGIMCQLISKDMELYEINGDLIKFMEICNPNKENIFTDSEIIRANDIIQKFEKRFNVSDYDLVHPTLLDKDKRDKLSQKEIQLLTNLKPILYIGLEKLLERYNRSEQTNRGTLRGVLIEQDMLSKKLLIKEWYYLRRLVMI
jgi:phospholipid-transporting ATPase